MDTPALDFFKFAAPNLMAPIPGVSAAAGRGVQLPANKQRMPSSLHVPNVHPQFTAESSSGLQAPPIAPGKVGEFMALEFFKAAQGQPFSSMAALKAAPPAPRPPTAANQATTRIIRKPAPPADAPKTAEFSALAYFAQLGL